MASALGLLLVVGPAGTAVANDCFASWCFQPVGSELAVRLGGLPQITIPADPSLFDSPSVPHTWISLPPPEGHAVGIGATVWSTVGRTLGTALFTGVPLISNLTLSIANDHPALLRSTAVFGSNPMSGSAQGPIGPTSGGHVRLTGQAVVDAMGGPVAIGVGHVGGAFGETTTATISGQSIRVEHGPFVTQTLRITQITSNPISIPGRTGQNTGVAFTLQPATSEFVRTFNTTGGFRSLTGSTLPAAAAHTVTISGSPFPESTNVTWEVGVTVVSPLRIDTGTIGGVIPGAASMHIVFAPEPEPVLPLLPGAAALAVVGRRRMRGRDTGRRSET